MNGRLFAAILSLCSLHPALGFSVSELLARSDFTVKGCGTSVLPPKSPDRIVGGKNVRAGEYPWMVSLQEEDGDEFEHVCGAAVINENWIVTAAHCVDYVNRPWKYQALVGLHKLSKQNAKTVQLLKITKIVLHKDYDEDTYQHDIALLRTAKPIDLAGSKGYVNGICVPPAEEKDPKGYATVIGWGHTYEDGYNSDTLKEVLVPIIPRDLCNEAYDEDPYDATDEVDEFMICAGMAKKDSCQNDSGGPLFQTDSKGVSTLIGIVSHGAGCGEKYYPGVYTRVSKYRDWMENIVNK